MDCIHTTYRIHSNLIRTPFTISEGYKIRCGLETRADLIRGRELDFGKIIEPLYVPEGQYNTIIYYL